MTNDFRQISIRGRYIYCYLCLKNVILSKSLDDVPDFLDAILKTFTSSSRLDDWQDMADDVMPSRFLDDSVEFKVISQEQATFLQAYYQKNTLAKEIIEELIWLGISNLYVGFNSNITFQYVKDMLGLMANNRVQPPDFSIISSCSVTEKGGWGNRVDLDDFLQ